MLFNLWNENRGSLILKNEFKKYNNQLSKIIKKAKTMYEIKKLREVVKILKMSGDILMKKWVKKRAKKD